MNALSGVQSDTYIQQAIIQKESHFKDSAKKLDFKDVNFSVKVRNIHKIEKKSSIGISAFNYENKEKHLIYV